MELDNDSDQERTQDGENTDDQANGKTTGEEQGTAEPPVDGNIGSDVPPEGDENDREIEQKSDQGDDKVTHEHSGESDPVVPDGDEPERTELHVTECPRCLKPLCNPVPLGINVQDYRGTIKGYKFSQIIRRRFKCDKCGRVFISTEYFDSEKK